MPDFESLDQRKESDIFLRDDYISQYLQPRIQMALTAYLSAVQ